MLENSSNLATWTLGTLSRLAGLRTSCALVSTSTNFYGTDGTNPPPTTLKRAAEKNVVQMLRDQVDGLVYATSTNDHTRGEAVMLNFIGEHTFR